MFAEPDPDDIRMKSTFFSLMFAAIGGVSFFTMFLQVYMYTDTDARMLTDINFPVVFTGLKVIV